MNSQQLELGFTQSMLRITIRRQQTLQAQWWFAQMRRAVDSAIDWQDDAPSQVEQYQLTHGQRPSLA